MSIEHDKYDIDCDGSINKEDISKAKEILGLELREERADAHRGMAWVAMISIIIFTAALFSPIVSEGRVTALADLLGLFYIAQAGVVGTYMGVTAWMSKGQASVVNRVPALPSNRRISPRTEAEL